MPKRPRIIILYNLNNGQALYVTKLFWRVFAAVYAKKASRLLLLLLFLMPYAVTNEHYIKEKLLQPDCFGDIRFCCLLLSSRGQTNEEATSSGYVTMFFSECNHKLSKIAALQLFEYSLLQVSYCQTGNITASSIILVRQYTKELIITNLDKHCDIYIYHVGVMILYLLKQDVFLLSTCTYF